jgi:hypothetical protein
VTLEWARHLELRFPRECAYPQQAERKTKQAEFIGRSDPQGPRIDSAEIVIVVDYEPRQTRLREVRFLALMSLQFPLQCVPAKKKGFRLESRKFSLLKQLNWLRGSDLN